MQFGAQTAKDTMLPFLLRSGSSVYINISTAGRNKSLGFIWPSGDIPDILLDAGAGDSPL